MTSASEGLDLMEPVAQWTLFDKGTVQPEKTTVLHFATCWDFMKGT